MVDASSTVVATLIMIMPRRYSRQGGFTIVGVQNLRLQSRGYFS